MNNTVRTHPRTLGLWFAAAVVALAIAAAPALMDGPDDVQAEFDQVQAIKELRASEAGSERRQVIAQQLCSHERGPNSEARWLDDGSLACTIRHGVRRASL